MNQEAVIYNSNDGKIKQYIKNIIDRREVKSCIYLPIFIHGELHGTVGFESSRYAKKYTDGEIGMIRTFADILASLLNRENIS